MATGLLVLVVGRATRLASLLTGHSKTYDAIVRLGRETTTDDADGEETGEPATVPDDRAIRTALARFHGTFSQVPSAYSAKKINGTRAYRLARTNSPVALTAADVTVHELTWQAFDGRDLHLRVQATAGFYVRALARDLGRALACGGHLAGLRRIRSGPFAIDDALALDDAEARGPAMAEHLITPAAALADLDFVELTAAGLRRVLHGNVIGPEHVVGPFPDAVPGALDPGDVRVRILLDGRLVALGRRRAGALHPVVVLG
jgi:tRNA pseudouridine55 synthase